MEHESWRRQTTVTAQLIGLKYRQWRYMASSVASQSFHLQPVIAAKPGGFRMERAAVVRETRTMVQSIRYKAIDYSLATNR
ncbi:MAG TPA: hypothetical protein VG738_10465 [Chitinophagaceae bacterium]|nr:hypothetical protein [Chitinophagaceae bacterium]